MAYTVLITSPRLADTAMELLCSRAARVETMSLSAKPDEVRAVVETLQPDGIISRTAQLTRQAICATSRLRAISKHGAGFDNIDVQAASDKRIPIATTGAANAQSVAEHAAMLTCALARHVLPINSAMRQNGWPRSQFIGTELHGLTLGLLGYGATAQRFAKIAAGFGMKIKAYSPSLKKAPDNEAIQVVDSIEALFLGTDVLSVHCALKDETRGLVDARMLERLNHGAWVINTARGAIINESHLIEALQAGRIGGAGLDTFETEPVAADNPLRHMDNVVVTPHIAGSTTAAMERVAIAAVKNLLGLLDGEPLAAGTIINDKALEYNDE